MSRLIDADALKEKKVYSHERHEYIVPVCEIDWLPTVEERPHGEWILDAVSPCSISWFRCSYCGYKYEAYKDSNFCPDCGASMRKEGETE